MTTYKGDVKVFKVPEPPIPIMEVLDENLQSNTNSVQQLQQKPKISPQITFDKPPVDLDQVFYELQFQGEKIQQSLDDLLSKIEDKAANKEQLEAVDAKDNKKDAKKEAKKPGKNEVQQNDEKVGERVI